MDSIEAIQADFLRGMELITNAFNRALALSAQGPVVPVAMDVRAEVVQEARHGPAHPP